LPLLEGLAREIPKIEAEIEGVKDRVRSARARARRLREAEMLTLADAKGILALVRMERPRFLRLAGELREARRIHAALLWAALADGQPVDFAVQGPRALDLRA
jgi:hypothetical protein